MTGASGYVGGRLLAGLQQQRGRLCCLARKPEYLKPHVKRAAEIRNGDVFDLPSLEKAFDGIQVAYYLIHSMTGPGDFQERDRLAAGNFSRAARAAGVERIIYLGGLGRGESLSPHLASRQEVGRIFRQSGLLTVELRASIIIGSGSASFEMIRGLVDRLPVMVTPRWVRSLAQPIAIEDVIQYLMQALDIPLSESRIFEIGGPDQVSYQDLLSIYARLRGLNRRIVPVPLLTTRLSSLWLGLVTPLYARLGRELIDSVKNETIVMDQAASMLFTVQPRGVEEMMRRALANEDQEFAGTRWCDALSSSRTENQYGGVRFGSRLVDSRTAQVRSTPKLAFRPIRRIGGEHGWYYGNSLWRIRGFFDLLVGGVGMRRGRPHPDKLRVGDPLDFWRVDAIEENRLLRLMAEMKLPGRAWLQFEVEPSAGGTLIRQTAIFEPRGLMGLIYWYALYPVHQFVFSGMLRNLAKFVEEV